MNTGSEWKLPLSVLSASVVATRASAMTHSAQGHLDRTATVMGAVPRTCPLWLRGETAAAAGTA